MYRSSEDIPSTILQSIVTSSVIPRVVVKRLTALLLSLSLRVATDSSFVADAPTAASAVAVRALLSQIQQRQPDILHEVADEACEGQDDETVKEGVDQLILSLSSVRGLLSGYLTIFPDNSIRHLSSRLSMGTQRTST